MRIAGGSGQRANYFDRNPLTVVADYRATGIAPHGLTVRATYTVPANRKAVLTYANLVLVRTTVATTGGRCSMFAQLGSGAYLASRYVNTNVVDGGQTNTNVQSTTLQAGESITVSSQDASTGGTIDWNLDVGGTEYDA